MEICVFVVLVDLKWRDASPVAVATHKVVICRNCEQVVYRQPRDKEHLTVTMTIKPVRLHVCIIAKAIWIDTSEQPPLLAGVTHKELVFYEARQPEGQ